MEWETERIGNSSGEKKNGGSLDCPNDSQIEYVTASKMRVIIIV